MPVDVKQENHNDIIIIWLYNYLTTNRMFHTSK